MPDMMKKYNDEVRSALQQKMGYKNVMQIPSIRKIVISTGIKSSAERDAFAEAKKHLMALAGQAPVITKARKNVSNFKLRVGMPVGVMVTLRGARMYEFLDRFVHNTCPRIRDFRGIPRKGFDGKGNFNMGISDVSVFTEVDADKLKYPLGINITMVTNAKSNDPILIRFGGSIWPSGYIPTMWQASRNVSARICSRYSTMECSTWITSSRMPI